MDRIEIPPQALVHISNLDISKAVFDLTTEPMNNKPNLALWTSNWNDNIVESGWINWNCFIYEGNWENALLEDCLYKIYPKKNAKVFELDTLEDFEKIPKIKPKNNFITNYYGKVFDYQSLQELGYDGLHITDRAQSLGHNFTVDRDISKLLYFFDCESTVWFNIDWIDHIELVNDNLIKTLKEMGHLQR